MFPNSMPPGGSSNTAGHALYRSHSVCGRSAVDHAGADRGTHLIVRTEDKQAIARHVQLFRDLRQDFPNDAARLFRCREQFRGNPEFFQNVGSKRLFPDVKDPGPCGERVVNDPLSREKIADVIADQKALVDFSESFGGVVFDVQQFADGIHRVRRGFPSSGRAVPT